MNKPKIFPRRYFASIILLVFGIVFSLLAFSTVYRWERQRLEADFIQRAKDRSEVFKIQANSHLEMLYYLKGLYSSSQIVDRREFHDFTEVVLSQHSDIDSLNWLPRVYGVQRDMFEESLRREGYPDFQITELNNFGKLLKAPSREVYFPICFIEPFEENKITLGFDAASDPVRKEAMDRAVEQDALAATGRINLIRKIDDFGCRIFLPIYQKGMPQSTPKERLRSLSGYVSLLFEIGKTMELSFAGLTPAGIDIYLFDLTTPDNNKRLLYFHASRMPGRPPVTPQEKEALFSQPLEWSTQFDFAGRKWQLVFRPLPELFAASKFWQSRLILAAGLLITVILFFYIFDLSNHAEKIRLLVDERTKALKESEEKYKILVENANSIILRMDTQGNITFFNEFAQDFFGYDRQDILGKNVIGTIVPDASSTGQDLSMMINDITIHPEKYISNENENMLRNGQRVWIAWTNKAVYDEGGRLSGILCIGNDISGLKNTQQQLQREKERAELLYKVVPSAIFTVDKQRRITSWNNKAAELTGYTAEEILNKPYTLFNDLHCKDKCGIFSPEVIKPILGKECMIKRKDGQLRYILKNLDALKDETGNVVGGIESFEDITIRKNIEEQLNRAYQMTWDILANAPFGIYLVNNKGGIDFVNPAMLKISGAGYEQFRQLNMFELPTYKKIGLDAKIRSCLDGGSFLMEAVEYTSYVSHKTTIRNFTGIPLTEAGEKKALIIVEDITERKELEKLKDEFVSNVSHELRTPLSIIKEGISLVLDNILGPISAKQQNVLVTAKENIDRLARIIDELLDISKIESGKLRLKRSESDIVGLAKKVAFGFSAKLKEKNLDLKFDFSAEKIIAQVDADKITQVFVNLLGNAVKFTEKGYIEICVLDKGSEVECCVKDTGVGIAQENLAQVFDKFQQFGRVSGPGEKGTGLGLSIVKGLVQLHNGRIRVESKPSEGTKFIFTLPKTAETIY